MNQQPAHSAEIIPIHARPRVYGRAEHPISRKFIADSALKVLYRLNKAGFRAFLVGGSVRDLLLGRQPKDFDVATDALPEQVRELFRNCRLIGRRFRLAHVQFGSEIIEVATFRAAHDGDADGASMTDEGRILRDNVYGTLDDDVWRRDFTGSCGLLTFVLKGRDEAARTRLIDALRLFGIGYSWGGFESLVLPVNPERDRAVSAWPPAGWDPADRHAVRLWIGLEDPEDLIADLAHGLQAM